MVARSRSTVARPSWNNFSSGTAESFSVEVHMAQQPQHETHQNKSPSNASTNQSASSGSAQHTTSGSQSDQERSITPQREGGVSRRPQSSALTGRISDPLTLMRRMSEDMDRLFQQFGLGRSAFGLGPLFGSDIGDDLWTGAPLSSQAAWTPQVETFRRSDKFVVRADLPGMKKNEIKVEIDGDILAISGERSQQSDENRDGYYRSERSYGQFYRAIPLPEGSDADSCDASFHDGVLEVSVKAPKEESRKAKQVAVK
jgi:HSP20 family protein